MFHRTLLRYALTGLAVAAAGRPCGAVEPADKPPTPVASIPLEFHENLAWLKVRVNNSEPLWFIFDSGASTSVIDKGQCPGLGVAVQGSRKGRGAGAGTVDFFFAKDVHLTVDGITLDMKQAYAIDLTGVSAPTNKKLTGLLGYELPERYVVALDFEKARMNLFEPKTYVYRGPGQALPLEFKNKQPYVKGSIRVPGQPPATDRQWLVDTGSGDTLTDGLIAQSKGDKTELTGGRGLGNESRIWMGKADEVVLGRFHFRNVTVYAAPASSAFKMMLGNGLLRQFTVIFDYANKRMILEPNSRYQR